MANCRARLARGAGDHVTGRRQPTPARLPHHVTAIIILLSRSRRVATVIVRVAERQEGIGAAGSSFAAINNERKMRAKLAGGAGISKLKAGEGARPPSQGDPALRYRFHWMRTYMPRVTPLLAKIELFIGE